MSDPQYFRVCSTCKTPIAFQARYYVCSVSTCNRRPTALYFCSVPCWDAHVPDARHRDAWAEEATAPTREEFVSERASHVPSPATAAANTDASKRRVVSGGPAPSAPSKAEDDDELAKEVLVVVSKLKAYVRARAGMNTSDGVVDVLSDHLRDLCRKAIRSAAQNSRKTVLARDFEAVLEGRNATE
jgi:hypothetical protein